MLHTFPNAATGRRGRRPRSRPTINVPPVFFVRRHDFGQTIHLPLALAAPCTPCIPPWITRQYSLNIRVSLKEAVMALPQLPARFGALDAAFLNFECKEMPLHIGGVCVFEGVIPFERFVATIESKLDLIPRYREKVMFPFLNDAPHIQHKNSPLVSEVGRPGDSPETLEAFTHRLDDDILLAKKIIHNNAEPFFGYSHHNNIKIFRFYRVILYFKKPAEADQRQGSLP